MALKVSTAARSAEMQALSDFIGPDAALNIYSGTRPASPAAAITGTLLATIHGFYGDFANISAGVLTANAFTAGVAVATGMASHCRLFQGDGVTVVLDINVGETWIALTAYALAQQVNNGGNCYKCTTAGTSAGSGGPAGTGSGISDGSCVWAYVGTADMTLVTTNIGSGATVGSGQTFTITDGNA